MQDNAHTSLDMRLLAAKVLIVEDRIETSEGVPDKELIARWRTLVGTLREALCSGPSARGLLRVPVTGACVTVRRPGADRAIALFCENISYAGLRLVGETSGLHVGETVELLQLAHSGGVVQLAGTAKVVWRTSASGMAPGKAGLMLQPRALGKQFAEFYQRAYKRFLNQLAVTGRAA